MIKPKTNKKTKYNNKKVELDGYVFDSKAEAKYYSYLLVLQARGEVKSFEMQQTFELQPKFDHPTEKRKNGKPRVFSAIKYTPDFVVEYKDSSIRYVDVKGSKNSDMNRDFKLRAKLFMFKYNVTIHVAYFDSKTKSFIETALWNYNVS